jgi:hypothetical protein
MNHRPLKNWICILVITLGLEILLAGCATVDPHPFQQYAAAVKEAGDGLDKVLAQDIDWSRDKYIENVLDGSVNLAHTAILGRKTSFTVSFPETGGMTVKPTFYQLQDARVTLLNLNEATEKYIKLLGSLAGSDTLNPKTFDAMAKETDASLNSIIKKLDAQVPGNAVHLFSVGSAEIARLIIENKRHDALVKVLTESQASIDDYCHKCLTLLMILDESLATDYSAKAMVLEGNFSKISLEKRAVDPKARSAVEHLLQLNSDYLVLVQALKSAKNIYEALPQGHRELLKSVQKQPTGFEAIKSLYEEGKRLKSIYDELNKPTASLTTKG